MYVNPALGDIRKFPTAVLNITILFNTILFIVMWLCYYANVLTPTQMMKYWSKPVCKNILGSYFYFSDPLSEMFDFSYEPKTHRDSANSDQLHRIDKESIDL